MMAATVNPELPVDLRGNPVSLDDIKAMIRMDVAELAAAHAILDAAEAAGRVEGRVPAANRGLLNRIRMWDAAHDLHWAWYRQKLDGDAGAEGA